MRLPALYITLVLFFIMLASILGCNLYYSIRSLGSITRYSRAVWNYSADEGRSFKRRLRLLVFIALSSSPLALIPSVMGSGFFFNSLLTIIGMSAIAFEYVILAYTTITRNYVLIRFEEDYVETKEECMETQKKGKIDKTIFEQYISLQKPFLNPELRITDIAGTLRTNRTYLFAFINGEYGMNFSEISMPSGSKN